MSGGTNYELNEFDELDQIKFVKFVKFVVRKEQMMHDSSLPVGDREAASDAPATSSAMQDGFVIALGGGAYFRRFVGRKTLTTNRLALAFVFPDREAAEKIAVRLRQRGAETTVEAITIRTW